MRKNKDEEWEREYVAEVADKIERISRIGISKEIEKLYGIILVFQGRLYDWIGDNDRNEEEYLRDIYELLLITIRGLRMSSPLKNTPRKEIERRIINYNICGALVQNAILIWKMTQR